MKRKTIALISIAATSMLLCGGILISSNSNSLLFVKGTDMTDYEITLNGSDSITYEPYDSENWGQLFQIERKNAIQSKYDLISDVGDFYEGTFFTGENIVTYKQNNNILEFSYGYYQLFQVSFTLVKKAEFSLIESCIYYKVGDSGFSPKFVLYDEDDPNFNTYKVSVTLADYDQYGDQLVQLKSIKLVFSCPA